MGTYPLLAADIRAVFSREVAALGGNVTEAIEDGACLYARGVFDWLEEVRPDDKVRGGVALRSNGPQVFVHPYVYRLVCKNGAIAPRVIGTEVVELPDFDSSDEAAEAIGAAIRACGARDVFSGIVGRMQTALEVKTDLVMTLMSMMQQLRGMDPELFGEIVRRFVADEEPTAYGLHNAATSLARDTHEPRVRWDLEELGGTLVVSPPRAPRPVLSAARSLVSV